MQELYKSYTRVISISSFAQSGKIFSKVSNFFAILKKKIFFRSADDVNRASVL